MMRQLHLIQLHILQKLLYARSCRYSDLTMEDMEGGKFSFHLNQLLKNKLIFKKEGRYALTDIGKECANRMDLGDESIRFQAKVSIIMCCIRKVDSMSQQEYLLYTRKKNPFYGFQGFPTGKVKRGEDIIIAAKRELKEETGLTGTPELFAIRHYKVLSPAGDLLEDKIFFGCRIQNPKGILKPNTEGDFEWVLKNNVTTYLKRPVKEIPELLTALDKYNGKLTFTEGSYKTGSF